MAKEDQEMQQVVRILQRDIEGSMSIYSGLTKIKGISWGISRATCKNLGLDPNKKIGSLEQKNIEEIENFLKNPEIPSFLKNRRKDLEEGSDKHLTGSELNLRKDFDIKRMKKIKSYRGYRHIHNLPVRGQMTKANFRKNKAKGVGIKKKGK